MILMILCFFAFRILPSSDNLSVEKMEEEVVEKGAILNCDEISRFAWGDVLKETLNGIGVEEIKEIKIETAREGIISSYPMNINLNSITFKIETIAQNLWVSISNSRDNWKVGWVKDYENKDYYYVDESDKYVG